jgi:hypothetical protein
LNATLAALMLALALPSWAGDVDQITMFRNLSFAQTGDGNSLSDNGSFLSTSVFTLGGEIYSSVNVAFPGPSSPLSLLPSSSTAYGLQSLTFATQSEMDMAFPQGTYQYTLQGSGPALQASFVLGGDAYALSQPYLDGSSYSSLQGMNASLAKSLTLSPFAIDPAASSSSIFFTVYDVTLAQFVFNDNFLPANTGIELIPAHTLQADHQFTYELIFSSRVLLATTGANQDTEVGYERRAIGQFSTAVAVVPEPSTGWLFLAGLGLAGFVTRRRLLAGP